MKMEANIKWCVNTDTVLLAIFNAILSQLVSPSPLVPNLCLT